MTGRDGEESIDALFAGLPEDGRRTLEQIGMGLPELRRMAAQDGGTARVRGVLSEFTAQQEPRRPGDDEGPPVRAAVRPWALLLAVAVAGVVLTALLTPVIHETAVLVGVGCGLAVLFTALRTRESRGGLALRWITVAAYAALVLTVSFNIQQWYLKARGAEQTVTIAAPLHQWAHGTRETYCRVRLSDGSVHQVLDNREKCADRVGLDDTAVVDPAGHYRPFLGTRSDIGGTAGAIAALGAAAVLILAPVSAVVLGRRGPRTGLPRAGRTGGPGA
ncbi:hypothetical protein ACFV99_17685 [Streptomyces sp. NPDC059944]|uniref:hypothetical protein n=1 Tax=unclassified Streptomyces TaxID=2593676 RepID=UPI003637C5B0